MRYVAAYLLAVLGGNEKPTAKDLRQILGSVGVDAEDDKMALVIKQLHGKDVEEVIEAGNERLATVTFGGAPVSVSADSKPEEKEEEKKDDKKPVEESDSDSEGGLVSLFDD